MNTIRGILLVAFPSLLLGTVATSAFAQIHETQRQEISVTSPTSADQPFHFMSYFPTYQIQGVLPDFSSDRNNGSIPSSTQAATESPNSIFNSFHLDLGRAQETAVKAVTFETLSAALETGIFVAFFGGTLVTAGGIFAVSFVSSTAIYVAHEYAWDYFSPPELSATSPERIASKAATYRAVSILRTFALGSILGGTHEVSQSVGFALSTAALDTALYGAVEYSFEKLFDATRKTNDNATSP